MKYGLLIWNVVLTLIALYLLITQLTSGKKVETTPAKSYAADSASLHAPFRIAYFEMDSVENNFQMVRDVQGEISRKEKDYNNDLAKLDYAYQTRVESYRSKGKLSNDEIEKAQRFEKPDPVFACLYAVLNQLFSGSRMNRDKKWQLKTFSYCSHPVKKMSQAISGIDVFCSMHSGQKILLRLSLERLKNFTFFYLIAELIEDLLDRISHDKDSFSLDSLTDKVFLASFGVWEQDGA